MTYFSVVIPTYNRIAMLARVLDALGTQIDAPEFEVLVVNDGSGDATVETVSRGVRESRWRYAFRFESQTNSRGNT